MCGEGALARLSNALKAAPLKAFRHACSFESLAPVSHRNFAREALSQSLHRNFSASVQGRRTRPRPRTQDEIARSGQERTAKSRESTANSREPPFGVVMSDDWKTYRTRFVVRARQLTQPFAFTDPNGHEHHGRPGDYVIESREGLRISRREIFEDVYVAMEAPETIPSFSPDREVVIAGGHASVAYATKGHGSAAQTTGEHGPVAHAMEARGSAAHAVGGQGAVAHPTLGHGSVAHPTGGHGSAAYTAAGGHGFSRAAANEERIGALAPAQPPSEHVNLPV